MIKKIKYFKDRPVLAEILDLVVLCVITIIIGKLLTSYIILTGYVPSGSMETLIMTDDRILANRTAYWSSDPKRGDIVVFYAPDEKANGNIKYFVKRVIGLPGETVTVKDQRVYIDGVLLDEPYLAQGMVTNGDDSYTVPEGHFFMLGDNRTDSLDSRAWEHKFVPREDICGKVFVKYSLRLNNLHIRSIKSYNDYDL